MERKKVLSVKVDGKVYDIIKKLAEKKGVSMGEVARKKLNDFAEIEIEKEKIDEGSEVYEPDVEKLIEELDRLIELRKEVEERVDKSRGFLWKTDEEKLWEKVKKVVDAKIEEYEKYIDELVGEYEE